MNADIILNEPIMKVLTLQYVGEYKKPSHDSLLHIKCAFEYHVTEGQWLLLESSNHYVTIGHDGLQKYDKPFEFSKEKFDWWSDSDEDCIDYRDTLFIGQKIHSIELQEDHQTIYFDNFSLKLYVYDEAQEFEFRTAQFGDGVTVMSVGGHLLNRCECTGKAELLCDERNDFAVRCSVCHRATYFDMVLKERIEAWNRGDAPCTIHTGLEALKELLVTQNIKYIALSSNSDGFEKIDDTLCYCPSAIIGFDNSLFMLSSQAVDQNKLEFTGHILSDYNKDFWSNVITPQNAISFVGNDENAEGKSTLRFKIDDADLQIETTYNGLLVTT